MKKSDNFGTDSPKDVQKFTSDLIRSFPDEADFSAIELLRKYPFLADHRSCVLDLAYEEFCRLREKGTQVRPTEFAGRFRDVEQSLHRVIEFDQIIHDHPSFVENVPETHWPVAGDLVSGFVLLERIGRGVLSRVFVASQPALGDRKVVAKICVRGEQEASLIGRLSHRAIAGVHSISRFGDHGLSIICMPYETRATLHHLAELLWVGQQEPFRQQHRRAISTEMVAEVVNRVNSDDPGLTSEPLRKMSVDDPARSSLPFSLMLSEWGTELSSALSHAHSHSVFHCDVKPGNVLILPGLTVKLLDFNLATSKHLSSQVVGGTLPYMASEQLLGVISNGKSDAEESGTQPATDVFGLCATLWHVISGNPPFGVSVDEADRRDAARCLLQRQGTGITEEQNLRAAQCVDLRVLEVLRKGLNYDPADRYRTADDLRVAFSEVAQVLRAELEPPAKRPANMHRRIAIGLLAFAGATGIWYGWTPNSPTPEIVAQVRLHVRDVKYKEARNELTRIPPGSQTSESQYLDLYCRMQLDIQLLEQTAVSESPKVPKTANQLVAKRELLSDFSQEWLDLKVDGPWKEAAVLNAAFVLIQDTDGIEESRKVLRRLPEPRSFLAHHQRILAAEMYYDAARTLVNERPLPEGEGYGSERYRQLESLPADLMTPRECRYRICVELDRWKQLQSEGSDATAVEMKLRSFLDDAVVNKISPGELYRYLERITGNQFKYTFDQYSGSSPVPLYLITPEEIYEAK